MPRGARRRPRTASRGARAAHLGPLAAAFALLVLPRGWFGAWGVRLVAWRPALFWAGAALVVAGLALAVWARRHLAAQWSLAVTLKVQHRLVTSGPYRWVCHPIYSGLLLAFAGSALALDEPRGALAVALAALALGGKLVREERWLRASFGAAWDAYCARTGALWPRRR